MSTSIEPKINLEAAAISSYEKLSLTQNSSELAKKTEEQQVASSNLEIVRKPVKKGDLGRLIKLRTNHYAITIKNSFTVFQYDVELTKIPRDADDQIDPKKDLMKIKGLMR